MPDFIESFTERINEANKRQRAQAWDRRKLGLELRQKYELYFVALAFTVAGLAVQSARPGAAMWAALAEIVGWVALGVAGCIGLWRVSLMWLALVGTAEFEGKADESDAQEQLAMLERRIRWWSKPQFGLFAIGLGLLMIARAAALISAAALR